MKEKKVYEHKATSREYLIALTDHPSYCLLLNAQGKDYYPLINWIATFANTHNDNSRLPDLKIIANQTGLPYSKVGKYLSNIYNDILELNTSAPLKFKNNYENMYCLMFNYLGACSSFNIGLPVKPAIDEQVDFSFIIPKVGSGSFWVKSISHELINGKQMITVGLTYEIPNQYLHLLKEKAYLYHELDFMEYYGELDSELKNKLLKTNKGL